MNNNMCYNCGCEDFIEGMINKVFNINGELFSVENIPVLLCNRCQEPLFLPETTEKIRILLHEKKKPIRIIQTNVYEYAS